MTPPLLVHTIPDFCRIMGLAQPEHPQVCLVRFEDITHIPDEVPARVVLNLYSIWLKRNFKGKMIYGHQPYDFDSGLMSFFSPGQVLTSAVEGALEHSGWWLLIHPDFVRGAGLASHSFFSYAVSEALHLSPREEAVITGLLQGIEQEYRSPIDAFTQRAILAQLGTLLVYADRFYRRQFITRQTGGQDVLARIETVLNRWDLSEGLPTVSYVAAGLALSPGYLSDLLRSLTGRSTQQHIQDWLIERAKDRLSTTTLSVSEIAYELGFSYPQSFSKLFKSKVSVSPQAFRAQLR